MNKLYSITRLSIILVVLLFTSQGEVFSQDVQFSQFYATSLYMNPAYAGAAQYTRGMIHQRWQWPAATVRYNTTLVAGDGYFDNARSGVGGMLLYDVQNASNGMSITSYEFSGLYAYELPLSRRRNKFTTLRMGTQLGGRVKTLGGSITMPSQFDDNNGFNGAANSYDLLSQQAMIITPDIGLGTLLYSQQWWIGFSGHHINYPRQNFFSGGNERLPARFAVIGGYKINVDPEKKHHNVLERVKEYSVIPTFHYKSQGRNDQLDLGVYGVFDMLLVGVWYRGIPIKRYNGGPGELENIIPERNHNNESIVPMFGFNVFKYAQFRYSYDIVISRLTEMGTAGAHEIHLTLVNDQSHKRKKKYRRMPCPDFHHPHPPKR